MWVKEMHGVHARTAGLNAKVVSEMHEEVVGEWSSNRHVLGGNFGIVSGCRLSCNCTFCHSRGTSFKNFINW